MCETCGVSAYRVLGASHVYQGIVCGEIIVDFQGIVCGETECCFWLLFVGRHEIFYCIVCGDRGVVL